MNWNANASTSRSSWQNPRRWTLASVVSKLNSLENLGLSSKLAAVSPRQTPQEMNLVNRLLIDPALVMRASGMVPDQWQETVIRSALSRSTWNDLLLNCSRQVGKTQTIAAFILNASLMHPDTFTLVLSRSERQSRELLKRKLLPLWKNLGSPMSAGLQRGCEMEFSNGSRILALPGDPDTIMGFSSVNFLVIDEASRVPDDLYYAARPFTAAVGGKVIAMSTPRGKRGWFWEEWRGAETWRRVEIPATSCKRLTPAYLAKERKHMGELWYSQEYNCRFNELIGSLFSQADIEAATAPSDVVPIVLN
jgi:hypothetical protein